MSLGAVGALVVALVGIPVVGYGAWRSEGPAVGILNDVAVDPTQPDTIYAATSGGGVWRSDDGGKSWALPGDEMVSREVEWIQADPKTPGTVWAGIDASGHNALWRTIDRGKTWKSVKVDASSYAVGQPIAFAASAPDVVFVPSTNLHYRTADGGKTWTSFRVPGQDAYAFAVHPQNPKIVFAGGRGQSHHMSRSQDGGVTWKPYGEGLPDNSVKRLLVSTASPKTMYATIGFGRVFRTTDGGATWTELEVGLQGTDELFDVCIDPNDPQVLLAATKNGLRRSTDSGDTWSTVGEGLGGYLAHGIAFHPTKKGTVFAAAAGSGFFKSTDGGDTFQPASAGFNAGWPKRVWAPPSGTGPVFVELNVGLYRMDAPGEWTEIQAPFDPGESADVDGFVYDRMSPKKVYAHDGGSWWRSEDSGKSWSSIEVPGASFKNMMKGRMSSPGFRSLAQDPGDAKVFYCGTWTSSGDEGMSVWRSRDGGKKWEPAGTGLPATASIDSLQSVAPATLWALTGKAVYRTADGGKSWSQVRAATDDIQDFKADPTHPERAYMATKKGLFRTGDSGATWTKVDKGIKGDDVDAVAVSPVDGQVFAGTFHGVFRSADGGVTWAPFAAEGMLNTDVRALAVGGGSSPRLYAGLAGGSVWSVTIEVLSHE